MPGLTCTAASLLGFLLVSGVTQAQPIPAPAGINSVIRADVALCPCTCYLVAEVADNQGITWKLCLGYDPKKPHGGFRIGSGQTPPESLLVVPIGSASDSTIVAVVQSYLDTHYTYRQQEQVLDPEWRRADDSQLDLWVLVRMLAYRDRAISTKRWLDANYSAAQQEMLFNSNYVEIESARDREAYTLLCDQRNGTLVVRGDFAEGGCTNIR